MGVVVVSNNHVLNAYESYTDLIHLYSGQISLSRDNGVHFYVIESMIGGCPLKSSYNFTIPPNLESSQYLLAWTWYVVHFIFVKIGERTLLTVHA
jgi:hypothetical protein